MKTCVIYCVWRGDALLLETETFDRALAVSDAMPGSLIKVRIVRCLQEPQNAHVEPERDDGTWTI